jgi:hypothetical protein
MFGKIELGNHLGWWFIVFYLECGFFHLFYETCIENIVLFMRNLWNVISNFPHHGEVVFFIGTKKAFIIVGVVMFYVFTNFYEPLLLIELEYSHSYMFAIFDKLKVFGITIAI